MMGALDGNLYFNFFLNAVVDVPAIILVVLIMPRFSTTFVIINVSFKIYKEMIHS